MEEVSLNAPVVVFLYNRPDHAKKTIDALAKNYGAEQTDLVIYVDHAEKREHKEGNLKVKDLVKNISGFKKINIVYRDRNYGLALNIQDGVTEVVNEYGRVIVIEDDIVTSPYFLKYVNDSLDMYEDDMAVGSISGCNYPAILSCVEDQTYFLRIPLCWGWATWKNRWDWFDKNLSEVEFIDSEIKHYINFDGEKDYFIQAIQNRLGKINTWFVFWYIALAKRKCLTLFPKYSLVDNIGHDGSGENCGEDEFFFELYESEIIVNKIEVVESIKALEAHQVYFKSLEKPFLRKAYNFISRKLSK